MTPEHLCSRIRGLGNGEVEILSRLQFDTLFAAETSFEAQKAAAAALGERCGCRVLFVGTDSIFVRYARRQDGPEVVIGRERA